MAQLLDLDPIPDDLRAAAKTIAAVRDSNTGIDKPYQVDLSSFSNGGGAVSSVAGRTGAVVLAVADVAGAQSASQVSAAIATALAGYASTSSMTASISAAVTGLATSSSLTAAIAGLATVARTGAFADLIGIPAAYTLPVASSTVLGGVKQGAGVTIAGDGTISVMGSVGVATFNARSGTVTLQSADVTAALGFSPIQASGAPVQSVAGRTGAVTLAVADVSGAAPLASPTFTGAPVVPGYLSTSTAASTYQPLLGFTPYSATNPAGYQTAANVTAALGAYLTSASAAATYAPLASPALTGTPTAPTATVGTNTTQLATTAFVGAAVAAATPSTAFARNVYTAAGAIATSSTLAILNGSSGTLAMTLANGTSDGQPILIKQLGTVASTVTAVIDGASQTVTLAAGTSGAVRDALKLRWSAADTSWLAE